MPQTNVTKVFAADSYYHIYNHVVGDYDVFASPKNTIKFLKLFDRYLGEAVHKDINGRDYPKLNHTIKVLGFCLMSNHFHLLVYQSDERAITDLMRRIMTSFSMSINLKNNRRGVLFETAYKASRIESEEYLLQASRYIHLNPLDAGYQPDEFIWSSFQDYVGNSRFDWLNTRDVLLFFEGDKKAYFKFVQDGINLHLSNRSYPAG